jgi:ring-1,2-phenylacetyl-CoA epoxidase subunit PaaE
MSINAGFHRLTVAEVRRETADAVSIRFDVPAQLREAFAFRAGQHLTLKADIGGEDVRRTYSLCVAPSDGEFRIAIKTMPGGRFSTWANAQIKAGQTLEVLPPMGRFVMPDGVRAPYYVALAGGSGITPVLSILKTALQDNALARATLLYGNRDSASIIFLEELAALKNRFLDRLEVYHFLENEAEEIELFNGRLDAKKCDEVFSTLVEVASADAFFICGPGPMMDAAEAALLARGVPASKILIERLRRALAEQIERMRALMQAAGTMLTVTLDGRRSASRFRCGEGNILESVQAAVCRRLCVQGRRCTTCRAKVTAGTVEMKKNYGLSEDEVADGYVLTCQAIPTRR